jgi:DNA-binding PadR family transcriptional regulator
MVEAVTSAGRSVIIAGGTVVIAVLGLFLTGLPYMYGVAIAASLAVVVVMLAAVSLPRALLSFLGPKVDRLRIPLLGRTPRAEGDGASAGGALEPRRAAASVDRRDPGHGSPARAGGPGARHAPRLPRRRQRPTRHPDPPGVRPVDRGVRARYERAAGDRRRAARSIRRGRHLRPMDTPYIFSLSMRELFLALLARESGYGYELRQTLQQEFGELLPALNAGQIYSTLARLERDGLVVGESVAGDGRRKRVYELTEAGHAALARWVETPVPGTRLKDEFFMKFVVVVSAGLAEPKAVIERQRREYLQSLRDLDALLAANGKGAAAELLVEGAVLHAKADLEWLDLIERRLTVRKESR